MYRVVQTVVVISLFLLAACANKEMATEQRTRGEIAFRSNCQSCHILPKPGLKSDSEWPALVARYGQKAKLSETDINEIILYVTANN